MSRFVLVILLVATFSVTPSAVALAQPATGCSTGRTPSFVLGFADLKAQLGTAMGDPLTCEFPDPSGTGDIHQRTTTGLAFWRKATNTPTFTDGSHHWAMTSTGLVAWTGSAVDPPSQADAYPELVVSAFITGCTRAGPGLDSVCRCAIDAIQSRYTLADFLTFAQSFQQGDPLPADIQDIVIGCVPTPGVSAATASSGALARAPQAKY